MLSRLGLATHGSWIRPQDSRVYVCFQTMGREGHQFTPIDHYETPIRDNNRSVPSLLSIRFGSKFEPERAENSCELHPSTYCSSSTRSKPFCDTFSLTNNINGSDLSIFEQFQKLQHREPPLNLDKMYDENSNAAVVGAGGAASTLAGAIPTAAGTPTTAIMSQLLNVKDSRWLQVEVCREFQRGQCARSDQECKFAHPPPHVDVQQGRVTACYDSIKGRCTRENPKCKYLHPPQHIKDQLLINGRNNLALKNLMTAQLQPGGAPTIALPQLQAIQQLQQQQQAAANIAAANMMSLPYQYYQQMIYPATMMQAATTDPYQNSINQQLALLGALPLTAQPAGLTVPCSAAAPPSLPMPMAAAVAAAASRKRAHEEDVVEQQQQQHQQLLLASLQAAAAMQGVPCKRPTMDKNGTVVYGQPTAPAAPVPAHQQQFNPYLLQSLQGYVPAVSFSGQLPPRY